MLTPLGLTFGYGGFFPKNIAYEFNIGSLCLNNRLACKISARIEIDSVCWQCSSNRPFI